MILSLDAIKTEDGIAYYLVRVQTNKTQLGVNLPIIPGMVAKVDVITGAKTVMGYLTKPLMRLRQVAMRER